MLYDVDTPLYDSDGKMAIENDKPATVRLATVRALLADTPQTSADEKLKRYQLFKKFGKHGNEIELDTAEATLCIKSAEVFPALVYGQLSDFYNQTK